MRPFDVEDDPARDIRDLSLGGLAKVEQAEQSLDSFINSRSRDKAKANEKEELWRASERRVQEKRRRENRQGWISFHGHMQSLHQGLAEEHASRRSRLLAEDYTGLDEGPGGEAA